MCQNVKQTHGIRECQNPACFRTYNVLNIKYLDNKMFPRIVSISIRCYSRGRYKSSAPRVASKRIQHIGPPLITCKNPEFDLHLGDNIRSNAELGSIPLVSDRWTSRKSKGDTFTIHPHIDADNENIVRDEKYQQPFDSFRLYPELVDNITNRVNLRTTTYIQHQAIPTILNNKHALIAAETGCGKTIAYLLPILQHLLQHRRKAVDNNVELNTPRALIITPGRELTHQIGDVCKQLCHNTELKSQVIIGGHTKSIMRNPPMDDIDILISSIGALSKLITTNVYKMHEVRHVVLDEADTLLDESFVDKLRYILKRFPVSWSHDHFQSTQIVKKVDKNDDNPFIRNFTVPQHCTETKRSNRSIHSNGYGISHNANKCRECHGNSHRSDNTETCC